MPQPSELKFRVRTIKHQNTNRRVFSLFRKIVVIRVIRSVLFSMIHPVYYITSYIQELHVHSVNKFPEWKLNA